MPRKRRLAVKTSPDPMGHNRTQRADARRNPRFPIASIALGLLKPLSHPLRPTGLVNAGCPGYAASGADCNMLRSVPLVLMVKAGASAGEESMDERLNDLGNAFGPRNPPIEQRWFQAPAHLEEET